jgi:hypothetical protein
MINEGTDFEITKGLFHEDFPGMDESFGRGK